MEAIVAAIIGKYSLLEKRAISEEAVEKWKESSPYDAWSWIQFFLRTSVMRIFRFLFCLNQSELCFCHLQLKGLFLLVCTSVIYHSITDPEKTQRLIIMTYYVPGFCGLAGPCCCWSYLGSLMQLLEWKVQDGFIHVSGCWLGASVLVHVVSRCPVG